LFQDFAKRDLGLGGLWLKLDDFRQVRFCLRRFAELHEQTGQVFSHAGLIGLKPDGFFEILLCFLPSTEFAKEQAEIAQGSGLMGLDVKRCPDQLQGCFVRTLLAGQDAQEVQRIGMAGISAQDLAIESFRFEKVASLMMFQGSLQNLVPRRFQKKTSNWSDDGRPSGVGEETIIESAEELDFDSGCEGANARGGRRFSICLNGLSRES
jgi:hypothetical protein